MVDSPLPQFLIVSRDRTLLFNDAFGQLSLPNHFASFGRPVDEALPDLWQEIRPSYEELERGGAVQLTDVILRSSPVAKELSFDIVLTAVRHRREPAAWIMGQIRNSGPKNSNPTPLHVEAETAAADELRLSEERYQLALDIGRIATWDWDVQSGAISWSDEHFRMEGYKPGEVDPSYEAWTARIHPDDLAATLAVLFAARDGDGHYEHEFRFKHPNGAIVWSAAVGRFFYNSNGDPIRMIGAMLDVTERHRAVEGQRILIAELQHRTRNLIGLVRSIFRKTLERSASLDDCSARYEQRLSALARVQGLLSQTGPGERVTFDELIRAELSAITPLDDGARVTLDGPSSIALRSDTVQTLALAIHELATNALKYGALRDRGHLSVRWRLHPPDVTSEPILTVEWQETGVLMPKAGLPPQGGGYGRELIERALPYQLNARTTFELGADGVRCTISLPASATSTEPEGSTPS